MTAIDKFWSWFIQHESELFNLNLGQDNERDKIFDEVASELHRVNSGLTFEFGPSGLRREFVISAGGLKRSFAAVTSLVEAAPPLDRWQVIAFRPRRPLSHIVEFRGKRVDPKDVQFSLLDNRRMAGLYLFIPGFEDGNSDWKQIGYLLLDETLGEYDVEFRLGLIKMFSSDAAETLERHPLIQLPELFDSVVARLEGSVGKPS